MKRLSLSRNVMFGFLSWLVPVGFTFVLTPVIVHGLGVEAYGIYALVMGFVAYSFTFNVGRAITKYVAAYHANNQTERIGEVLSHTLVINLIVGVLSAGSLALLTNVLVTRVLRIDPSLQANARLAFYLASICLLFTMISQVFSAVPQAVHRFDVYSLISTTMAILTVGGSGLLVWFGYGAAILVGWTASVTGFSGLIYFLASRRLLPETHLTFRLKKDVLAGILRFSSAVIGYQILANLLLLFERGLLTRTLGAAAVTYYVVPMTMGIYIHAFISSLTLVVFPLASEAHAMQDAVRLRHIYTRAYKYVSVLALFMTVTVALGSHRMLTNWMGPEFAFRSSVVLTIQAVVFGLIGWGIISWQMSDGLGRPGRNALLVASWIVIAVPIMMWLTPTYGVVGMAFGRLATVLTVPVYVLLTERMIFGKCLWEFWRRTSFVLGLAGVVLAGSQALLFSKLPGGWFWLLGSIGFSGATYLGVLWTCGYLDPGELAWLRQLLGRFTGALRPPDLSEGTG
jgi:O-antigen/teichoic acid export membrane protein